MAISLYEFLELTEGTFDTCDTDFDITVTVDWVDTENDYYEKFCRGIVKLVDVKKKVRDNLVCGWSEMIEHNMAIFKEFTKKNWTHQYEDDEDEFVYQWIREIHYWLAGCTSEPIYQDFVENYLTRME